MTKIIIPEYLRKGDTVSVVSPSSSVREFRHIQESKKLLESWGLKVLLSKNISKRNGFLAGTDQQRVSDLNQAFSDKEVKAIFAIRGGYGSTRILSKLKFNNLKKTPKFVVGFSDITAIHAGLSKLGILSLHAPTLASIVNVSDKDIFKAGELLRKVLFGEISKYNLSSIFGKKNQHQLKIISGGKAKGQIIGGNLSLLSNLIATKDEFDYSEKVLFLEDVSESPYSIDRMLTHLLSIGRLDKLRGVVIGKFALCVDKDKKRASTTTEEVLSERLSRLKIPIISGLDFGHVKLNAVFPIGGFCSIDTSKKDVFIELR